MEKKNLGAYIRVSELPKNTTLAFFFLVKLCMKVPHLTSHTDFHSSSLHLFCKASTSEPFSFTLLDRQELVLSHTPQ